MTKFDDLESLTTDRPIQGSEPQMVLSLTDVLESEWSFDEIAHALWRFFGEDDGRKAVQLVISGRSIGYLNRQSFFEPGERTKLGEAQLAVVPGSSTDYSFIKLKCPLNGCTAPVILKAYYDHRSPPACPVHPEVTLEVT